MAEVDASAERSLLEFEELKRDGTSVVGWAIDAPTNERVLLRRLVRSRRYDEGLRDGLRAEAEYSAILNCERCPLAELIWLEEGELALRYRGQGVELDRFLSVLEASGRALTARASVALLADVIHNAGDLQRHRPYAGGEAWGHGEIAPRSVLLGGDGFGRLYELRLLSAGFRSSAGPGSSLCRAPELVGGVVRGTPTGDIYAIGILLSMATLGRSAISALAPPIELLYEASRSAPVDLPAAFVSAMARALGPPEGRPPSPDVFRSVLREAVPFDFEQFRTTVAGLASIGDALLGDREAETLPESLFLEHSTLTRSIPRPALPRSSSRNGAGLRREPLEPEQPEPKISPMPRKVGLAARPPSLPRRPPSLIAPAAQLMGEPLAPPRGTPLPEIGTRYDPEAEPRYTPSRPPPVVMGTPLAQPSVPLLPGPAVMPPRNRWLEVVAILVLLGLLLLATLAIDLASEDEQPHRTQVTRP